MLKVFKMYVRKILDKCEVIFLVNVDVKGDSVEVFDGYEEYIIRNF